MGETPSPAPLLGACWLPSLTRRDLGARLPVFLIFIDCTWINLVIKLSDKQVVFMCILNSVAFGL